MEGVRFYHGENDIIENVEIKEEDAKNGQKKTVTTHMTHGKNKKIEFSNVSKHWGMINCLIYTSTIVAGVDFPEERFDRLIGALCPRTTSPSYFIQ